MTLLVTQSPVRFRCAIAQEPKQGKTRESTAYLPMLHNRTRRPFAPTDASVEPNIHILRKACLPRQLTLDDAGRVQWRAACTPY
jgi:hypothetical protein